MKSPTLAALLLVACACAGPGCSARSLDYLNSGYTPDPPLPPGSPVETGPPDAGLPPRQGPDAGSPDTRQPSPLDTPPPPDAARPADLADTGGAQPEAGPPPEVVFIVGDMPLSRADTILERRLRGLGVQVVPVVDDLLGTVDTARAALIFISATASVMNVGARFRDVSKPVVLSEPLLYDDMGMVDSMVATGINRGVDPNVTTLSIDAADSPLAARLSGNVVITSQATDVSWGTPNGNAIRVASLFGQPARVAVLAYESGAQMPELIAPARRVGLFLSNQSATLLTPEGLALLDAAITWALSR
jgi:hypothetical protein